MGGMSKTKPVGVPFRVQAMVPYASDTLPGRTWNFAIREGEPLDYRWPLAEFADGSYHLQVHGPNGFLCEFKGNADDPDVVVDVEADAATGKVKLLSTGGSKQGLQVREVSYTGAVHSMDNQADTLWLDVRAPGGWYEIAVEVADD